MRITIKALGGIWLLCLITCLPSHAMSNNANNLPHPQKHIIGAWPHGFFSAFLGVLNQLAWCEKNNKIPVVFWDNHSLYYNSTGFNGSYNAWEYYFQPVSDLSYAPGDRIYNDYAIEEFIFYANVTPDNIRTYAHRLINTYIKLKPCVQNKIDHFFNQYMAGKKTIGIHLRGTDKHIEEKPVSPDRMVVEALKHADNNTQFFIASDEQRLLDIASKLLSPYKVISYNCYRSDSNKPLHYKKPPFCQLGEDVLVEAQLLAQCNLLIYTSSNVSTGVLYFNPNLRCVLLR